MTLWPYFSRGYKGNIISQYDSYMYYEYEGLSLANQNSRMLGVFVWKLEEKTTPLFIILMKTSVYVKCPSLNEWFMYFDHNA